MVGELINFDTCEFPIYGKYSSGPIIKFVNCGKAGDNWSGAAGHTVNVSKKYPIAYLGKVMVGWNKQNPIEIVPTSEMLNIECICSCDKNCNNCNCGGI